MPSQPSKERPKGAAGHESRRSKRSMAMKYRLLGKSELRVFEALRYGGVRDRLVL